MDNNNQSSTNSSPQNQQTPRRLSPSRSRRSRSHSPSRASRSRSRDASGGPAHMSSFSLSPLREGPVPKSPDHEVDPRSDGWAHWFCHVPVGDCGSGSGSGRSGPDLKLLLGVMGAPLAPVPVSSTDAPPLQDLRSLKDAPIESSSAQYILHQYVAACGGQRLRTPPIRSSYTTGKITMVAHDIETATKVIKNKNPSRATESGSFVLWRKNPNMWYMELAVGPSKVHAGSNGRLVWRHTTWLGARTAKGPVRPLRRVLQGLDPSTTASIFSQARCTGEKKMDGEDCFVLKINADPRTLRARSEGPAEIIRHVLFGYFSHKTGLLVHLEDSKLTRIQTNGGDCVYWETTVNSSLGDYRPVEGIMIAHSGKSVVTLFKFGDTAMAHTKTRMEECWSIDEVAFNVPGLHADCFIPPAEVRLGEEVGEAPRVKDVGGPTAVASGKPPESNRDSVVVKMRVLGATE